uniref:carboxylesterase n=1 Tax=Anopheles maculatus TaxID=74869 RepID=A0A182T2N9_9DIPT
MPTVQAAELQLTHRQGEIFFYHFGADTELNKFRQLWKVPPEYRGANHADDVCYLFGSSYFGTDAIPKDSSAWRLRKAMCCLWTSFAKTSVPRLEDADVNWTSLIKPAAGLFTLSALEIGTNELKMVENHLADPGVRSVLCKLPNTMVIRKLYVPPTVVKTNPLPPVVDPNFLPPATSYQPPAEDVPIIVEPESTNNGGPLVFADDVELELVPGKIVGRRKVLPNGSEYFSYQGIPYAEPPVGDLRFRSPVPLEKFAEQPLQCGTERGTCLGVMMLPVGTAGGEDCLYLNVYTTSAPSETAGMLKPVMVWIHGGGFYTGSANSDFYGPEFLLQHGVILVTLNYRLGPLGFLALPSAGIHGNQGLKDQQLALRWVHDNIARFGGDPTNVTLFGESAGSASVNWHYLCPKSRQYFHKAICQSGSVLCPWGLQYQPEGKARKLAAVLGYEGEDDAGVLETLRNASVEDLVSNSAKAFEDTEKSIYFVSPFIPSIEDPSSEDAIILQRGEELLKQPNATTIPLIHGLTSAEGLVFYGPLQQLFDELASNLGMMLPLDFGVPRDFAPAVVEEIRQFYFQDKPIERDEFPRLVNLIGDVGFNFPVCAAAELHSRYQQEAPLYFYRFSYENELNQMRKQFHVPDGTPGASHADELPYLFSGSEFTAQVEPGSAPDLARTLLCRLWTNFAKFGSPTPEGEDVGFQWDPLPPTASGEPFVLRALDLNDRVEVVENPLHDRIQFWKSLAERFNPNLLP